MHRVEDESFARLEAGQTERVRALARELRADGEAKLRLPAACPRRFARLLRRAERLDDGDAALSRLLEAGPRVLSAMEQAASEPALRLPARAGKVRMLMLMKALLCGEEPFSGEEALLAALHAFDEARPLTVAELWALGRAAKTALLASFLDAAAEAVHGVKGCPGMPAEEDANRPEGDEASLRRARDARARALIRLDALLDGLRMVEELDGQAAFSRLSRVARELARDPAGVYPRMDDDSRALTLTRTAELARALGVPELSAAREAVDAARGGEGARATACWWLETDEGRAALAERMGVAPARLKRIVPDPEGKRCAAILGGGAILLAAGFALLIRSAWLLPALLPAAWFACAAVAGRIYPRIVRPNRLLKLELERIPDEWRTLVAIPTLLSGERRADEVCDQLEALASMESDGNLAFLLLGDFADGPSERAEGDGAIADRVRARIAEMNARAGRERCFYLHRPRILLEADGRWMGRDRKRGALMDLNRLLLGEAGAEDAFSVENACAARLAGRFSLVVTLDADTRLLPGAIHALVGAMDHPMNEKYAVLQPAMAMLPSACVNEYVRLFAGKGGVSAYPASVSDLWQDMTGEGLYAGKGIYRVRAFRDALEGALPEGRILSHDLIEGALAGAGFVDDVAFYDGHPAAPAAARRRRHRWTRGDWQLLPLLMRGRAMNGARIPFSARLHMLDNLLRSLRAPALLGLILAGLWFGSAASLALGIGLCALDAILGGDALRWRRATAELALLPGEAACMLDAVLRTLWRLAVSGRHLMDWTPAADSEGGRERVLLPGVLGALLALPGLADPGTRLAALGLMLLFGVGPAWVRDMAEAREEPLSPEDAAAFARLAEETWRFFSDNVDPETCPLPPDNVQLDPPVGAARRTSPTNIGLYLVSCLAAFRLGLIDGEECARRQDAALRAVEDMEKWRGHLYNWIDLDTLSPLAPRYVSSVDSGNLAACLLLCANAPECGEALSARMRSLAEGMDFAPLYDGRRRLFAVGLEPDSGARSRSHYDLLASESRILSFTAILLGKVPVRHWRALGRPCTAVEDRPALLSWSGTLFEFLLPEMFLPAPEHSLLGESARGAVAAQRALGRRMRRPWGVSESGCYAFDAQLNYQYQAYGLPALSLSGSASTGVVAPYAAALAAMVAPHAAAEDLRAMRALGWTDGWGMLEAADYLRGQEGKPALVKSHMAHHQGMILCALCEALTGRSLSANFMAQPRARALSMLLEEEAPARAKPRRDGARRVPRREERHERPASWRARPERRLAETHLLSGAGATAWVTMDGAAHYVRDGILGTRFAGDLLNRADAACVHITELDTGADAVLSGRGELLPGAARFRTDWRGVAAELDLCVSPEDGALLKTVTLRNGAPRPVRVAVADVEPVALSTEGALRAHAIFQNLFVEGERIAPNALMFRRRSREEGERWPRLLHACWGGPCEMETDLDRLAGRMSSTGAAGGISPHFGGAEGGSLNPVSALRTTLRLRPGETRRVRFALCLAGEEEDVYAWLNRWEGEASFDRALRLARARADAELRFLGLDAGRHALLMRMAALLADGHLAAGARAGRSEERAPREALWALGLSGDRPILTLFANDPGQEEAVRALLRAHAFYRGLGVSIDLALVNDGPAGYDRPVRDMLAARLDASALRDMRGMPGGAWLIDGAALGDSREALIRSSAAAFDAGRELYAQIRAKLSSLDVPAGQIPPRLDVGASTLKLREYPNGFGGFEPDGSFAMDILPDRVPPVPWCNILAGERGGALLTERGGGFLWRGSSRDGRLTRYGNDGLREGWGLTLFLKDPMTGARLRLLPGDMPMLPFRVRFDERSASYAFEAEELAGEARFELDADCNLILTATLENRAELRAAREIVACADWLMGTDAGDAARVDAWHEDGACFATGTMPGAGILAAACPDALPCARREALLGRGGMSDPQDAPGEPGGWGLRILLRLSPGERRAIRIAAAWAKDVPAARAWAEAFRRGRIALPEGREPILTLETPDAGLNHLFNRWLLHQVRASRVLGRTGFYQPGGAYGFRDQLQDMLALLDEEPERVRAHILRCAARQFEAGDALHWWHEPYLGVRTRVTDDRLFLPFVTAEYVRRTGDAAVLDAQIPWLEDAPIPEGARELYAPMRPAERTATLREHCLAALRASANFGGHGLALMGAGDWNDGMNRVGAAGKGESVWLSEFLIACAEAWLPLVRSGEERRWLEGLAAHLRVAVEQHGWDGGWYLRAYDDDGLPMGGASCEACRIDAISQAWAELAGLDERRCDLALDAAWEYLVDEERGIVRLLAPAFGQDGRDPGYIRAYPEGVRENGGQYTHGALWLLLALIRRGDGARAHRMLEMLLPFHHARTPEEVERYRVEPYVMAGDIRACGPRAGQGGWTWYTGAAAWMRVCILAMLGYERRGDRVRICPLLGDWPEVTLTLRYGRATYRLTSDRDAEEIALDGRRIEGDYIDLQDDGEAHFARFPARREKN